MTTAFADTSYYLAILNPRDNFNAPAVAASEHFRGRIMTSEYVLLELGNSLASPVNRPLFLNLLDHLDRDRFTQVIPATESYFRAGLELFKERPDKEWSLTDCISFSIMTS